MRTIHKARCGVALYTIASCDSIFWSIHLGQADLEPLKLPAHFGTLAVDFLALELH